MLHTIDAPYHLCSIPFMLHTIYVLCFIVFRRYMDQHLSDVVMLPYMAHKLRCHPMWSQILENDGKHAELGINAHVLITWTCSECSTVFSSAPRFMRHSTGRCPEHTRPFKQRGRLRYEGNIQQNISQPIRAGLLQNMNKNELSLLIASLPPVKFSTDADVVALKYIDEIASSFTHQQLLDNGFWFDDSLSRKSGNRYRRPQRKRKCPAVDGSNEEIDDVQQPHGMFQV